MQETKEKTKMNTDKFQVYVSNQEQLDFVWRICRSTGRTRFYCGKDGADCYVVVGEKEATKTEEAENVETYNIIPFENLREVFGLEGHEIPYGALNVHFLVGWPEDSMKFSELPFEKVGPIGKQCAISFENGLVMRISQKAGESAYWVTVNNGEKELFDDENCSEEQVIQLIEFTKEKENEKGS